MPTCFFLICLVPDMFFDQDDQDDRANEYALNPVGHQSTNWIDRFVFIVAIAAFTSFGTTSPLKCYCFDPSYHHHCGTCREGSKPCTCRVEDHTLPSVKELSEKRNKQVWPGLPAQSMHWWSQPRSTTRGKLYRSRSLARKSPGGSGSWVVIVV